MSTHPDGAYSLHQLFWAAAFGEISAGACVERALHKRRSIINTENDCAKAGALLTQAFQQAEAIFVGHGDVHHRDVDIVT
ncbi:hypothetical protein D3C80_1016510 [compost metagenome]